MIEPHYISIVHGVYLSLGQYIAIDEHELNPLPLGYYTIGGRAACRPL